MDAIRKKRPQKWRIKYWFLLHDNAPAHRSVLVKIFLAKNIVTILEHPLYWSGSSWFLAVPSTDVSNEGTALLWFYWNHEECYRRAEEAVTKRFPTLLLLLAEVCSYKGGLLWRKCTLYIFNLLYFSEIKRFLEKFWAIM